MSGQMSTPGAAPRRRPNEVGLRRAIGRRDGHLGFGDRLCVRQLRQRHARPGADERAELPARDQTALLELVGVVVEVVLVAHGSTHSSRETKLNSEEPE